MTAKINLPYDAFKGGYKAFAVKGCVPIHRQAKNATEAKEMALEAKIKL